MSLQVGLVTDEAGLCALRPEWEALWRRAAAMPFQSPAWLLAWWEQFGTGQARVAVLREESALAGVLPLYVLEESGGRKLLPIGAGLTDYQDALLAPGVPDDAVAMMLATVLDRVRADGVACCDLIDVPPEARLRSVSGVAGWRAVWQASDPCPVLALAGGVERAVPARIRRKLRMNRHRAERIGGWTVEEATEATVQPLLDELERLHEARWEARDEAGVFADPRVRDFHRAAAPELLAHRALRLQALRLEERIAAVHHALLAPGRLLLYLGGFDAAYAHESPGTLLLGHMIEQAALEGREVHFLRGAEAYKYAWGATDRWNATLHLAPA